MIRKGLVIAVILLFIGLALAPSINGDAGKLVLEPDSDRDVKVEDTQIDSKFQRIRDLVQSIDLHKIIVKPDDVIDTLEEISKIIEENEDCGCEDDSRAIEWRFPIVCFFLAYLHVFAFILLISGINSQLFFIVI